MLFIQSLLSDILRLVFRLIVVALGLVLAAGVLVLLLALASGWLLRALWAKFTGRPVNPWVMRLSPRDVFNRFSQRRGFDADGGTPGLRRVPQASDVTDVEVKDRR